MFRETLETMRTAGRDPRKGGRPSHDAVRMFKVLVLRELYALSDEQVEYQIADRLSFQRFTLDIDSTVVTRNGEQEGAARGYNPNRHGRPSHHPLLPLLPRRA